MTDNTRFYTCLKSFYAADSRRRRSLERSFGTTWHGRPGASYRAGWVRDTGELYVVRHGHPHRGGGVVEVAERRFGLTELHATLSGHQDVCGRPGSLGWLLERLRHQPSVA